MDEKQKQLMEELLFSGEKKQSFAKKLYFGVLDPDQLFPFPGPDPVDRENSEAYVYKVREFAHEAVDPVKIDREAKIPDSVIKGLKDLQVLGMTVPEKYGGLGMSQYAYCRVTETLAARCASTTLFVNVHQSIGLKALLLFGTDEQKEKWLPSLASGEKIGAFSLTEPNAGSDAGGVETKAVYDPDKKVYRLTGVKQWSTNASMAGVLTVMARTEDGKITAFLVTPDMKGFKVTDRSLEKVGMRGTWTANLAFDQMEVPEENILGPKGGGLKVALSVLDFGRTTFGAMCTGVAKDLAAKAVEHAVKRHQFGRPLASFELVKKKIALIHAYTYAMDAATYMTAGLIDHDVEDIMLESAMLKVFASEALWEIIYDTMQIYGGRSFFTDAPFERIMRDARLNQIGEGANEVMRAFIGVVGMRDAGMQLKGALSHPGSFLKQWAGRFVLPKLPVSAKPLRAEARRVGKGVRRFGFAVAKVLAKYREDVVERQLALDRIATSGIALYTAAAVLSKADSDLKHNRAGEHDLASAALYCKLAMDKLDCSLGSLFANRDSEILSVSDQITGV